MAELEFNTEICTTPDNTRVHCMTFTGMINTSTFPQFQDTAEELIGPDAHRIVFDLSGLTFINSSGLGELVRCQDSCREQGGDIVLISVPDEVIRTIRIIGFHTIIKIFPDRDRAFEYFDSGDIDAVEKEYAKIAPKPPPSGKTRRPKPHKEKFPRTPIDATIMLVIPQPDVFSEILEMRWGNENTSGRFSVTSNRTEAMTVVSENRPDLIIIDNTTKEAGDLCKDIKLSRDSNLISVVRLYAKNVGNGRDLRILENGKVSEPFEYAELFAVTETELRRTATEKKFLLHQTSFDFPNREDVLNTANDIIGDIARQADFNEYDASEIRTAVREAIDNSFRHGNGRDESKGITVDCVLDHEGMKITVTDEGAGFDFQYYLDLGAKTNPQERARMRQREGKEGGLGIILMMRCVDALSYDEGGHICRLTKKYS